MSIPDGGLIWPAAARIVSCGFVVPDFLPPRDASDRGVETFVVGHAEPIWAAFVWPA